MSDQRTSDHDRLILLDQKVVTQQREIDDLKRFKREMEALVNKGHGAWWMLLKVGLAVSALIGIVYGAVRLLK